MHYGKTYAQLLSSLPPALCENAIQYRQLKKVIKRIVGELSSLGLTPQVLHKLIGEAGTLAHNSLIPKVVYELNDGKSTQIKPQLRIWTSIPSAAFIPPSEDINCQSLADSNLGDGENEEDPTGSLYQTKLLWTLQQRTSGPDQGPSKLVPTQQSVNPTTVHQEMTQELVIPLVQEMEFYNMLTTTLESVSSHLTAVQSDFMFSLRNLSDIISDSVHPASTASKFHPHSPLTANAGSVRVKTSKLKSDLYPWRLIFQLYLEAEVFESVGESTRGERSIEESEKRWKLFVQRLTQRGLGDREAFKMKQSAEALTTFLNLNLFILNVKKFLFGNAEATRKILKKHAKRTALPLVLCSTMLVSGVSPPRALLSCATTSSLSRTLVQAIGETLIPIIPHIDDYACLICTSIAFKPIRLTCGHIFCVRCLVKMQKRNKNLCPMCRAPSVLAANRDNVDWGMLNFMQDWFPLESKEKLLSNEKEASAEELEEMGIDPNGSCLLM